MRSDCIGAVADRQVMDILYPEPDAILYLPTELGGQKGEFIFEVAHRNPESQLHWHLDDFYVGTTRGDHQWHFQPVQGKHRITITDNDGNSMTRLFTVLSKDGDE